MAADKKATFTIQLTDLMSGSLGKISATLAVLRQGWLAVSSVVQTAIGVMQSMLNEYSAQETAINKVNIALKNQGIVSQEVTNDYIRFAGEMQKTTVFADEQVMEMEALLATFGLVGNEMKNTIKLAADLSVGLGLDLRTATLMLGKAALGETGTLSRYGIVIDNNISKAEKFAEVQKQVSERFGGSAAAQTDTYAGKVAQLSNAFSEVKEAIGSLMVGPALTFITWVKQATDELANLIGSEQKAIGVYGAKIELTKQLVKEQSAYVDSLMRQRAVDPEIIANEANKLKAMQKGLEILKEKNREELNVKGKGAAPVDEESVKLMEAAQAQIDAQIFTQEQLANIKTNAMAEELIAKGQQTTAIALLEAQQTANSKRENMARAANMLSTLQFISSLSNSHNKTLATIGKAAAISTATIDTYAAANKALASAPPPWNFGLAALVTTAGLANVAQISGMKLADGGMVMPKSGGVSAVMAEAGRAEVAIPLDDQRTKEKLRDVFGGGGTNIIIQAGTIVADEYSVQQFAQKIDEKLFEMKRNGRSNQ